MCVLQHSQTSFSPPRILFFTHNLAILIAQKPLANMKNMSDFGHKMLLKVKKIKKIGDDPLQLSTIGLPLNL